MSHQGTRFIPCAVCARQPLLTPLCEGCAHNKQAISLLSIDLSKAHSEAEGARLLALELADAVRQRGHIDWCPTNGDSGVRCTCNYEHAVDARKKLTKGA